VAARSSSEDADTHARKGDYACRFGLWPDASSLHRVAVIIGMMRYASPRGLP